VNGSAIKTDKTDNNELLNYPKHSKN